MIISSNSELYAAVRNTSKRLNQKGMLEFSQKLHEALSISSMPGEVLGEIKIVLQNIPKGGLSRDLTHEISLELAYIDSIIG